jgi:hypothetical protein
MHSDDLDAFHKVQPLYHGKDILFHLRNRDAVHYYKESPLNFAQVIAVIPKTSYVFCFQLRN